MVGLQKLVPYEEERGILVRFDFGKALGSGGNEPRFPREPNMVRLFLQVQGWGICVRKFGAAQDQDPT